MAIYKMKEGKKKKTKWRVRVFIDGVRKDRIVAGTKAEAKKVEAQMLLEREAAVVRVVQPPKSPSFLSFCAGDYRRHAETHLKSSTWRNRQYQVARLMAHFGEVPIGEFTPRHIEQFKADRLREGVKPVAVNDDLKVLRAILQCAIDLEYPVTIPKYKKLTEWGQRRKPAWTVEEVQGLLEACARVSPEILPMVSFLANTGCRKGEAVALRRDDIDLEVGVIHLQPNEEWTPKSNRPREVPINDALRPFLLRHKLGKTHAFVNPQTGQPWAMWPERPWNRAMKEAGLKGGPHQLRHAYATHLVKETGNLFLVARILGHSHARTTEIYAHLLTEEVAKAGRAVCFSGETSERKESTARAKANRRWGMGE